MFKKIGLALLWIGMGSMAFAETCPSVKAIKEGALIGWKAYDTDDAKPLSAHREAEFKTQISQFILAEWSNARYKKGSIHCYYRDVGGSDLDAYLAKDNFSPLNARHVWYQVSGSMHCAANAESCAFKSNVQLARR